MSELKSYLLEKAKLVDAALVKYMSDLDHAPDILRQSMSYSLLAGGKRIRPILCIASAEVLGGSAQQVMPIACALEMIHAFSLIHDDLPAMDDDDLRRGKPTNHKVYGDAVAILAGDGLAAYAFEVASTLDTKVFSPERIIEVLADLAKATGSIGMIGGQVLDIEAEGKDIHFDDLKKLHRLKTGCLLAASVTCGAKLVCHDKKKIKALEDYGYLIGQAFQIADDILDIEGGQELGKDIGSDVSRNKATYPRLLGLDGAKKEASAVTEQALQALSIFDERADVLRDLAHFIIQRKK